MQCTIFMAIFLFASISLAADPAPGRGGNMGGGTKTPATGAGGGGQASATKRIFDFKLTPAMKTADLDNPASVLRKMIAYIVKGAGKASEYVSIVPRGTLAPEIKLEIHDDSIFIPGGNPANAQHGFRRTDVNPVIDKATTLTGVTTWYQTIRLDSKAPLVLTHGYLLSSIEVTCPINTHILTNIQNRRSHFRYFLWIQFRPSEHGPRTYQQQPDNQSPRLGNKDAPFAPTEIRSELQLCRHCRLVCQHAHRLSSIGTEPLKMVAGPVANDPKAMSPEYKQKGEYHIQLIKFPLSDSKVPVANASTPLTLEPIKQEHVFFSNVFATSGKEIEQPKFSASVKSNKPKRM
ncbi:hypothetical protein KEM48_004400 [Puccinia striiformis f. sp. tritici PST-130]|nr:hypothetical protein KEM48_004400 [Puccinia striiformis f. sp. tritici PST-130]